MDKLYIIGNGFDLNHELKTRYTDFKEWLKNKKPNIYKTILELYGIEDTEETNSWWSMFEKHLVDFDVYGEIIELASEYSIDYGSDNFRESDRYVGAIEAEKKFEDLVENILANFNEWINSLWILPIKKIMNNIDKEAFYINFNYTQTLETIYGVPQKRVIHLHGKVGDNNYILGHGRTFEYINKRIRDNNLPPNGLSEEELEKWYSENYDEVYENIVESTTSKFYSYKKNVDKIIEVHSNLFDKLSNIRKICIYGYSFSDIDNPYIEKIIDKVKDKSNLFFEVSWFSEIDKVNINNFFNSVSISDKQIKLIKLEDFTKNLK